MLLYSLVWTPLGFVNGKSFEKIWPADICFGVENLEAKQLHVHYVEARNRHSSSTCEPITSVIATEKEAAFSHLPSKSSDGR